MGAVLVNGFAQERFSSIREQFAANLANGNDLGASFAATLEGEMVVDLWGGWADEAKTRPWEQNTIVNVYSTTKTMMALAVLLLADRGELDWDAPVARYWPEFAVNGKAGIKVRHLMSHTAGLFSLPTSVVLEDLYDWDKMTSLLAAQAPSWAPGTAWGYHANTQGFLVGEVVRRITNRSLDAFFREEIAGPMGADFHIVLPESEDARVADLIPPVMKKLPTNFPQNELIARLFSDPGRNPAHTRTRAWRAAEMPAIAGHGNARSVALIHSILANGGLANGRRFISEAGCRKALELQFEGLDIATGSPIRQGLGFYLMSASHIAPNANIAYGGGAGGSLIVIDFDAHATFAFVMNKMRMGACLRGASLSMAMWNLLAMDL